ncbi:hypothetical protein AGMMS49959_03650 [Planctomycetales bacterium]|nr:hypothetical protein AGMMS49959_03650 [Planctomycetales bacterium]
MMGTRYSIATPFKAWWAGKKRKRALAQNNDYTKWHEEHDESVSVREYSEQAMTFAATRENR